MDLDEFKRHGGTELAAMSTSSNKDIAESYARSERGLVMSFATRGLSRGVDISMFSLYPKEQEYLYPPLTYMLFDESRALTEENGVTLVPILPQMA
jgi:arginine deiminase